MLRRRNVLLFIIKDEPSNHRKQSELGGSKIFLSFFKNTLRNDLSPILRMRGQYKTSHRNLEN